MDLIRHGLRLRWLCDGTDRLDWDDLLVLVQEPGESSALYRQQVGAEQAAWGVGEHLLASVLDGINALIWQNGSGKEHQRPKPVPRPQDKTEKVNPNDGEDGVFKGAALSITEMDEWRKSRQAAAS